VGDPVLTPVVTCTSSAPCALTTWQTAFPDAKVIQIQIFYGVWGTTGQTIYIDDVTIAGTLVPIEPETVSSYNV
jgi:hypothetical protein